MRMRLGIKMWTKVMVSCYPSSYLAAPGTVRVDLRVPNVPDIRHEVVAAIRGEEAAPYILELRRHQNIVAFNVLCVLLSFLKLFKRHEILQFEYLRSLLLDNNAVIVLCKMVAHPWSDEEGTVGLLDAASYRALNRRQFVQRYYVETEGASKEAVSSRIATVKVNAVRIIQKCIKHSLGHCRFLSKGLKCNEWMVRLSGDRNPVMRYYVLKLFKAMMPFLDRQWRSQESSMGVMAMITSSLRIGVNDQWRSFAVDTAFESAVRRHRERVDAANHLEIAPYYQWLALREPTERDYAETRRNPFFVQSEYGVPRMEIVAPKEWAEVMSESCHRYHEWLLEQMKEDEKEYERQREFIGMTRKEMHEKKRADRSRKIDRGLADIVIPKDFDAKAFLVAYLRGNADAILRKL